MFAVGVGLCVSEGDWFAWVDKMDKMTEYVGITGLRAVEWLDYA